MANGKRENGMLQNLCCDIYATKCFWGLITNSQKKHESTLIISNRTLNKPSNWIIMLMRNIPVNMIRLLVQLLV